VEPALENWVHHELIARNSYADADAVISYWRLASGIEVDFVVNDMQVAIEVKANANITNDHLKGWRQLRMDHPDVGRRMVVCLDSRARRTDDGIEILPVATFIRELWDGSIF
jgi:predicted AAA+ superfamily ATPase